MGAPREKWGKFGGGWGAHEERQGDRFPVFFVDPGAVYDVFCTTCYQEGFKCFGGEFFHHPGSANMAKCGKTTIGSFKKKGRGNDTKLRHDVSREVQK